MGPNGTRGEGARIVTKKLSYAVLKESIEAEPRDENKLMKIRCKQAQNNRDQAGVRQHMS